MERAALVRQVFRTDHRPRDSDRLPLLRWPLVAVGRGDDVGVSHGGLENATAGLGSVACISFAGTRQRRIIVLPRRIGTGRPHSWRPALHDLIPLGTTRPGALTTAEIDATLVHLAGSLNPLGSVSGHERFPLHGPAEGFRHGGIEVGDETLDPLLKMVLRCEVAAPEKLPDQDREPDFDLVDPGRMLRREVET